MYVWKLFSATCLASKGKDSCPVGMNLALIIIMWNFNYVWETVHISSLRILAEDDVCADKKLPIGHDIDQDDKEDNGNVSDGANRKVIIENETVDMDQTEAKTTPLEEKTEKPVMEIQVPPEHASSRIPKYIHKSLQMCKTL